MGLPAPRVFSFTILFLWLQHVFSYFIKLRTNKIAIWKILPATHSNYKQNIQFQNKNGLGVMPRQAELTTIAFDV